MRIIEQVSNPVTPDFALRGLYRAGALSAFAAALLFRRNLSAEWMLLRMTGLASAGPAAAPDTTAGWFALLQQRPLLGLTLLGFFDLVNFALLGWIFLAVLLALRKNHPVCAAAAGALALAGIAGCFASNRALTLLSLSRQYAAAGEAGRVALLAGGQAALALQQANSFAGAGIYPSFLLVTLAGLLMAAAMLRGGSFGKSCAWTGILANGFGLGYYLLLAFAPALTFMPLSISAVFLLAWYLMLGARLWALGLQ